MNIMLRTYTKAMGGIKTSSAVILIRRQFLGGAPDRQNILIA
jgi:hypothetical protein